MFSMFVAFVIYIIYYFDDHFSSSYDLFFVLGFHSCPVFFFFYVFMLCKCYIITKSQTTLQKNTQKHK